VTAIQLLDDAPGEYRPGVCNIGPSEIRRRRAAGVASLLVAGLLAIALLATGAPPLLRLAVVVPLYMGVLGLLQARARFCVAFAAGGIHDLGAPGERQPVADRAAHRADLRRAAGMALSAGLLAAAITLAFVLLPV
jgi:hypothetical protein